MAINQTDTKGETKEETKVEETEEESKREETKEEESKEDAKDNEKKEEKERLRGPDAEVGIPPDPAAPAVASRFPFPEAFYDPNTKKLMMHPVVAPDGVSYEKDGEGLDSSVAYYPNRALEAYIEEELDRFAEAGSVRGKLHHWGKSLRSGWQQLLEKSAFPSGEYRPLPDSFYCPISFDLIHEPAIDPDGTTYEKQAILHWLKSNTDSPLTRNPLSADQLRDNNNLLRVIEFLTEEEDEDAMHPSVRKWKAEHSTRLTSGPEVVPPPPSCGNRCLQLCHGCLELWCGLAFIIVFVPLFIILNILLLILGLCCCCCGCEEDTDERRDDAVQNSRAPTDPPLPSTPTNPYLPIDPPGVQRTANGVLIVD